MEPEPPVPRGHFINLRYGSELGLRHVVNPHEQTGTSRNTSDVRVRGPLTKNIHLHDDSESGAVFIKFEFKRKRHEQNQSDKTGLKQSAHFDVSSATSV